MGLVFWLEVQVGAAVLIEDSSGCVADDGIFGFVHFGEDVIQAFQLLIREARLGEKNPRNRGEGVGMRESCLAQPLANPALLSPHPSCKRKKHLNKPNNGRPTL